MKTRVLLFVLALAVSASAEPPGAAAPLVVLPRAATPAPLPELAPPTRPLPANPVPTPLPSRPAITPRPYAPAVRPDKKRVVAIDIGHAAAAPGAMSARGRGEFLFNQAIARLIFEELQKSEAIAPYLINPKGLLISLPMRTQLAAGKGAELFLAIHHDSAQDKYLQVWEPEPGKPQRYCDKFKGYGVFVSQKNPQPERSLQFGRLLGGEMRRAGFEFSPHHHEKVKGEDRPILDREAGVYEFTDLVVLKTAPMPAALLECGVIIHREEELRLSEPATQEKIARAAVAAIERFFRPAPALR